VSNPFLTDLARALNPAQLADVIGIVPPLYQQEYQCAWLSIGTQAEQRVAAQQDKESEVAHT
jgi:hypothetical protein